MDLAPFNSIIQRLEAVTAKLERGVAAGGGGGSSSGVGASTGGGGGDSKLVASLDAFTQKVLPAMESAARESGVADLVGANETVMKAFKMVRDGVAATAIVAKPKDEDWAVILRPVSAAATAADKACDNRSEWFQSRKAAKESLNIVALLMQNSPGSYVQDMFETVDFHITKALQRKNAQEIAWVKALKDALKGLAEWCKEEAKMGFIWKHGGQDAVKYFTANSLGGGSDDTAREAPAAAAPTPKPAAAAPPAGGAAPKAGGMAAIFGALQGKDASGLKKVTDDMKAKNLKDQPVLQPKSAPAAQAAAPEMSKMKSVRGGKGPRGDPILELQRDTNWVIENQDGQKQLVLENATMQQSVCIINCRNSTIFIKSKVKSIAVDGCEKVNVICGDVLSAVEFVNSDRIAFQTTGKVNAIAIDKCNGVQVHLPKESLEVEITTSKSCEMNVTIPDPKSSDPLDTVEMPIPEQFVTKVQWAQGSNSKLNTEVSSLYTH